MNKISNGDVISFKTVTGEEVVARVDKCEYFDETESFGIEIYYLKVTKPMIVLASQQGIALMNYMITIDEDASLEINMSQVVTYHRTEENFKNAYIQKTSGIILSKP